MTATSGAASGAPPLLDLVVPVYNEEAQLAASVRRIVDLLGAAPHSWRVTVVDNASTDATWSVASELAAELAGVEALRLPAKGRGRAIRAAWSTSDAAILAYTDVDLSTDFAVLPAMVESLLTGGFDLAVGSRLLPGARVVRGARREVISRGYNLLLRATSRAAFSDAQCGFKAIRADVAKRLLPRVHNDNWFFDTELLLIAEHDGLPIFEVPVAWVDDPDSRVRILATVAEDLRGLARMTGDGLRGHWGAAPDASPAATALPVQLRSFLRVGALTTGLQLGGFALLSPVTTPLLANAVTLAATSLVNAVLNRRFTFRAPGSHHLVRDQAEIAVMFLAALGASSAALATLATLVDDPATLLDVAVILAVNALVALARFLLLRAWVFNPQRRLPSGGR